MNLALTILLILAARAADLTTTWLATPTLGREVNPLVRYLGWWRTITLNCLLCPLFALWLTSTVFIIVLSAICAMWNICVWRDNRNHQ